MPLTLNERLRQLLGEDIPASGSASDTLFTEEEISDLLEQSNSVERAAYEGWRVKAARLSSLVDTTEGNVQRKFSQLLSNAQDMIKTYSRASEGPTEGRTRIGQIKRGPIPWQ
jgi:hypothetical protein